MIQNNISTDASPNFSRVAFESNGALLRENSASRASTQSVAGRAKAMTREAQKHDSRGLHGFGTNSQFGRRI